MTIWKRKSLWLSVLVLLALGGITYGVKNIEITGAYAAIANKGIYNKPIFYTTIKDHDGNVLLDNTSGNSKRVLKESTALFARPKI